MCCSARWMRMGCGHRWRRSPSGSNGGPSCSSRHASPTRPHGMRLMSWRGPARISCCSAMPSGPIRAVRPPHSRRSDRRFAMPMRRREIPPRPCKTRLRRSSVLMGFPRAILILAGSLLLANAATAQLSLTPQAEKPPASKGEPKPEAKSEVKSEAKAKAKKTDIKTETKPETKEAAPAAGATPGDPNADVVYAEFQRGRYKTTFNLATPRAQAGDPHAMTMLGELYSNGLGVKRDYAKA